MCNLKSKDDLQYLLYVLNKNFPQIYFKFHTYFKPIVKNKNTFISFNDGTIGGETLRNS